MPVTISKPLTELVELLLRQTPVLGDDAVRHADLAHGVQQRGEVDLLALLGGLARLTFNYF